jgi:hypothetical protein
MLMIRRTNGRRSEAGFALVLALLTLMMLTFLGLTLATTTSTELQIAQNYKWSQQAYYNAEAGLEIAKRFLLQQTWTIILPSARTTTAQMTVGSAMPAWTLARTDTAGNPSRNWEDSDCDTNNGYQGVGYGVVLDHENFAFPFQNVSTYFNQPLSGSFTVWVKRAVTIQNDGTIVDSGSDSSLVLTSEGTAPFVGAAASSAFGVRRRAVRIVQVQLDKIDPGDCEKDFGGQIGGGALNANYDACKTIAFSGVPTATKEVNANQ